MTLTLHGGPTSDEQTKPIPLTGHQFGRGTEVNFIVALSSADDIGGHPIVAITLKHDSTGSYPSWYCEWVRVRDVTRHADWIFPVHQWLSLALGRAQQTTCTVSLMKRDHFAPRTVRVWHRLRRSLTDQCLWLSIFFISPRSTFRRTERLTVFTASLITTMLTNLMFFGQTTRDTIEDEAVEYDKIQLTLRMAGIAVESILITVVVTSLLTFLFKKSTTPATDSDEEYEIKFLTEVDEENETTFVE